MSTYETAITDIKDGKEYIHGYSLHELAREKSFVATIYLLLRGELPTPEQEQMLNTIFTVAIDHGPGTASGQTARIVASTKSSLHTSVAAGILSMSERHGGAIEGAADFFVEYVEETDTDALAKKLKEAKVRVPGFGHSTLEHDGRSDVMFDMADKLGLSGKHTALAKRFHTSFDAVTSRPLPINVDGAMAAVLLDMYFSPTLMKGFFIIARVPGLVAQVHEEITDGPGLRRVNQDDIKYTGPSPRNL